MRVNIENVEELVFQDEKIWVEMPDLIHLRDQWRISRISPMLRAMGRKSLLEFLRKAKEKHENILSEYFKKNVTIDKIDRHLVKNLTFSVNDHDVNFSSYEGFAGYSLYRDDDNVYITFWR